MWQAEAVGWHLASGGFNGRIAGHSLRLLHEAVELCVASGAEAPEILSAVTAEIKKAVTRGEIGKVALVRDIREELADVAILNTIISHHTGNLEIGLDAEMKLAVLRERKWRVDSDGVLWRP